MTIFYHRTSPDAACSIASKKIFYSCTMLSDHGLNGYQQHQAINRQTTEGQGAEIVLEWTGPVKEVSIDIPVNKMDFDTLYIQERWRMFVRAPFNKELLKVKNIRFKESLDSYIHYPNWYKAFYIPKALQTSLLRKKKLEELKKIRAKYIGQELFLEIQ